MSCVAQYNSNRNKTWIFGQNAGLNFTSGTPVTFTSDIDALEGCAAVADTSGSLLFYTDGKYVFNRLGDTMPNGNNIVPYNTWSSSQGALIVPFWGGGSRYYLFSLEQINYLEASPQHFSRLCYSVVDMSLDGGFGDVVPTIKGIPMDSSLSEKMIAIQGNDCNIWLLLHSRDSAQFIAYSISSTGITGPIISYAGSFSGAYAYNGGVITASPDRSLIVCQKAWPAPILGSELMDFDANSGMVSNCRVLDSVNSNYGAEFSPDNSKLYVTCGPVAGGYYSVVQFDLSLPTISSIIASRTILNTGTSMSLKLGVDNKIYVSKQSSHFIGRINAPNTLGVGCSFIDSAINLGANWTTVGLPNLFVDYGSVGIAPDTSICIGASAAFSASEPGDIWSSSMSAIAEVDSVTGVVTGISTGTVAISLFKASGCVFIRSVTVDAQIEGMVISGPDTICVGTMGMFTSTYPGGTWSMTNPSATVTSAGIVSGIVSGMDSIVYTITNSCGSSAASKQILISDGENCRTALSPNRSRTDSSLIISPNPNMGRFYLTVYSAENGMLDVDVIDMTGNVTAQFTIQSNRETQLDLTHPSGVYILRARTNSGLLFARIVIQ